MAAVLRSCASYDRDVLRVALPLLLAACGDKTPRDAAPDDTRVLAFSRTLDYRHASIEAAQQALHDLAPTHGWFVTTTEDPDAFVAVLPETDVVVFLLSSGNALDASHEAAFEAWFRAGGGFVGVHSAADTEYDWPFYKEITGALFKVHPPGQQPGVILVEDAAHPATMHLPTPWLRTDEWYTLQTNPSDLPTVHVLLAMDEEASNLPAEYRMGYHPLAWQQEIAGGRALMTVLGHTASSYDEPEMRAHIAGAIEWARLD